MVLDSEPLSKIHAMFSPIVPSFFRIFFIKKWKSSPFSAVHLPLVLPPRFHGCSSPGSNITPQSARARIGQRTWASVAEQVKPARMMPTSPPSCKCTTRRYAFGRLRAVLCSSVWTPRSSVATLCAAIPRHPGLRLAQRGQDLTPSWRARPLQRSRTQLQLHGSVQLQCVVHPTGCGDAAPPTMRARAV